MKKKRFYGLVIILFLVILVNGCGKEEVRGENLRGEEKIIIRNIDDCYKYFKDVKLEQCLDVRYFDLAYKNKDKSYCEKISNLEIKENCVNALEG